MKLTRFKLCLALSFVALATLVQSVQADTVSGIIDNVTAPQVSMNLRNWCPLNIPPAYAPPGGILTLGARATQFQVQRTGGTFQGDLMGNVPGRFAAFCLEPLQPAAVGTNKTYTLQSLSAGSTDIGGMGAQRAGMIRELFGRFYPDFSKSLTQEQSAALQMATWEILREKIDPSSCTVMPLAYSDLDVTVAHGDIFFTYATDGSIALAQSYLNALNGSGPMASGLAALTLPEVQGQPSQDLLVQVIPEPSTSLLMGLGAVGFWWIQKRKRSATPS